MRLDEAVGVAQLEDGVARLAVFGIVEIDAQHADELAVLLDEHGRGAEDLSLCGHTAVVQAVVLRLVAPVHQDLERDVGQRRTDIAPADVVVGDGDDGTVFVGHVVQRDLIVRSEGQTEKLGYLDILLQQWICHVISPHF